MQQTNTQRSGKRERTKHERKNIHTRKDLDQIRISLVQQGVFRRLCAIKSLTTGARTWSEFHRMNCSTPVMILQHIKSEEAVDF